MEENFRNTDWNGYALSYDVLNELTPYRKMQEEIISKLDLGSGHRILDCACGSGNLVYWIGRSVQREEAEFFGVDLSRQMLEIAKKKDPHAYKLLRCADLDKAIPFPDGFFNQAVSTLTLYALPRPIFFLSELNRVLKPGGSLILNTPKPGYENGLILKDHCGDRGPDTPWLGMHESPEKEKSLIRRAINDAGLIAKLELVAECNRRIREDAKFYFPEIEDLTLLIEESGFKIIDSESTYANQDYLITAIKEANHE